MKWNCNNLVTSKLLIVKIMVDWFTLAVDFCYQIMQML